MKSIFTLLFIFSIISVNAQAYQGKEDTKFQVGANIQENGTGIVSSFDYGIGENISIGIQGIYLLSVEEFADLLPTGSFENAEFGDRFDIRARFNANLGNVLNIDENFDFYPGLNLGLKNFGGHVGARYFFSDGFGLYIEANFPFAQYTADEDFSIPEVPRQQLNNQFNLSVGASFNL